MSVQAIDFSEILAPVARYSLYNPSDKAVEFDYGGDTYVIPPAGVLELKDRAGKYHPRLGKVIGDISAKDIRDHAVGTDGRSGAVGGAGVRPLFGDPEKDALVKTEAHAAWQESQYRACRAIVYAHQAAIRNAEEHSLPKPSPDKKVMDAMQFLAELDAAGPRVMPFPCPICNWGFEASEKRDIHLETFHREAAKPKPAQDSNALTLQMQAMLEAQGKIIQELSAKLAEKPKRGRPPKKKAEVQE